MSNPASAAAFGGELSEEAKAIDACSEDPGHDRRSP